MMGALPRIRWVVKLGTKGARDSGIKQQQKKD